MELSWTSDWPKTKGRYWFYGIRWKGTEKPDLFTVQVRLTADKTPVYVCEGHFLYKEEGAKGRFAPLQEPDLPEL